MRAAHPYFPQGTAMERAEQPGQDKRRTGNSIKAGHSDFPRGNGNAAGFHCSGQNSHRGGNCIKALHCFFSQCTARLMRGLKTMLSVTRSAAAMMSSIFIVMRSDDGAVSMQEGGTL